ncbi:MAG: peptidoglycan-associated lipoprotein Pal [Amphiplicatus sp.]
MATKMVLKAASVAGVLVLLAACASTGPDVAATDTSNAGSARPSGPVPGSQQDLEENAGHRVFFGYDEYTLTAQAQNTLSRQAAWLKQYPQTKILIAGNCDERGTREYNLALGARRAEAARAYLVSMGVDGARITTVSYGKERPLDPRSTEEAWSVNRNATTTIAGVSS